jgi:hypothetical protein
MITCLILILTTVSVHAQSLPLFDANAGNLDVSLQRDPTTIWGGVSLSQPPPGGSQTILQGGIQVGSVCGFDFDFNFARQLEEFLETAPDQVQALVPGILFVILCQFYPSACDAYKHIQGYINQTLRFLRADCQKIMQLGHLAGISRRSEAEAQCVQEVLTSSGNIDLAMTQCSAGLTNLRGPNGVTAPRFNLMETLLTSSGASPAIAAILADAVPNVEYSASGSVFRTAATAQPDQAVERLSEAQEEFQVQIEAAVATVEAGGEPAVIDFPGLVVPTDAFAAIALMPEAQRQYEIGKMASNMALTKVIYDLLQAANHLDTALQVSELSENQREPLQRSYDGLIQEAKRLTMMKSVPDTTLLPQIDALLHYKAEREAWAAKAMRRDPMQNQQPVMIQETGQNTFGYPQ